MQIILDKLLNKESSIYKYINIELENNKISHTANDIILLVNNDITLFMKELVSNITDLVNDTISDRIIHVKSIDKLLIQEEYILSHSINMKSRIYKYIIDNVELKHKINNKLNIKVNQGITLDLKKPLKAISTKQINNNLDKFYTSPHTVDKCLEYFNIFYKLSEFDLVIEPSAGSGNFLLKLEHKNILAFDIEPEHKKIIKQDFLTYIPECNIYNNISNVGD